MQKIKLIWDFRGSNTLQMATHYNKHTKEFFELKNIDLIDYQELKNYNNLPIIFGSQESFKSLYINLKKNYTR